VSPSLRRDRSRLPRLARILLVGVGIDAMGHGLTLPFLVVYLHDVRGMSLATVGALAAVPPLVALALLGPLGVLIDRFGPRRVQVVALVASSAAAFMLSQTHAVPGAVVAQLLVGVGHAAFWPANQSLVAELVPSADRQHYFGVAFTLLNAGIGVGGLVSGLVVSVADPSTFVSVYVVDALSFAVPLGILLGPLRRIGGPVAARGPGGTPGQVGAGGSTQPTGRRVGGSYRAVLADRVFRRVLAVAFLASLVGYSQMEAGWTAFARTVAEASTQTMGLAFAVNTAAIVLVQLVVLRRLEGRRRTRALMLMAAVWALSWLVVGSSALAPGTLLPAVLLVASMGVFGLGETLLSPIMPAVTNDLAPEHLRGRYNATASLAFQAAAIDGPVVAGALMQARLPAVYIASLIAGSLALVALLRWLERVIPAAANGLRVSSSTAGDQAVVPVSTTA
jgi:MFS family permease